MPMTMPMKGEHRDGSLPWTLSPEVASSTGRHPSSRVPGQQARTIGWGWGGGCQEAARSAGLSFFAQKACLIVSLWPVQVPGCGWGQAWSRAVSFHVPSAMSLTCRGVAFSFLFAAPLILLVFATFLVGGNVQTLVCRSWESGELYEVGLGLLQLRGSQESESERSGSQRCRQERGTGGRR